MFCLVRTVRFFQTPSPQVTTLSFQAVSLLQAAVLWLLFFFFFTTVTTHISIIQAWLSSLLSFSAFSPPLNPSLCPESTSYIIQLGVCPFPPPPPACRGRESPFFFYYGWLLISRVSTFTTLKPLPVMMVEILWHVKDIFHGLCCYEMEFPSQHRPTPANFLGLSHLNIFLGVVSGGGDETKRSYNKLAH